MAADVAIVPATKAHIAKLARHIRDGDAAECRQAGLSVKRAARDSLACSFWAKAAVRDDGYVFAVWGVGGTVITEAPTAWLLTANGIERHARQFVRTVRAELKAMADSFGVIEAFIGADYAKAMRLFRSLGCHIDEPVDGVARMTFSGD